MASKDVYTLVTREIAILLELIYCKSIIEEEYEDALVYKIYELLKLYKDSYFSKHHIKINKLIHLMYLIQYLNFTFFNVYRFYIIIKKI